jgi:hypothetical protein
MQWRATNHEKEENMKKSILVVNLGLICAAVAIVAVMTTTTTTTTAAPSVNVGPCPAEPSCPGNSEKNPKAEVCHYDLGKPEGHINCQNEESIDSHIGASGHDRDYCAADTGGVCVSKPDPTPEPTAEPK